MDKNELKVQALLEKIAQLTAGYENQLADYRVEITLLSQDNQELREKAANVEKEETSTATTDKS